MISFGHEFAIVPAISPVSSTAARNSRWVSMENLNRCTFIVQANATTAATTIALRRATSSTGADASTFTEPCRAWLTDNSTDAVGADSLVFHSTGRTSYTIPASTVARLVAIEVDPYSVIAGSTTKFTHVGIQTGGSSDGTIISALALGELKYAGTSPPSVL